MIVKGRRLVVLCMGILMSKQIHKEVITNQVIGIIIGWLIVAYILMPLGKIYSDEVVATISTVLFFVASYIRIYFIRRYYGSK